MARIVDKPKSPKFDKVPLKEEEQKSWLEFKKLDKGKRVIYMLTEEMYDNEGIWPVRLDHSFVSILGDFAVSAFNKLCEMHVKKDISNNLRHHEVMRCTYVNLALRSSNAHIFFLAIEAIEEGILGVYKAMVACDIRDGTKTFVSFTLIRGTRVGKIARMLPRLTCLKSRYKTLKGMKEDLEITLETTLKSMKGKKKNGKVAAEFTRLKQQHKAIKGKCNLLYRQLRSQIPKAWNERTNPDSWSEPDLRTSGFRERGLNTIRGYDYLTVHPEYSCI